MVAVGSKLSSSKFRNTFGDDEHEGLSCSILYYQNNFEGGFQIDKVLDEAGHDLPYFINKTMMRINLKQPLKPGEQMSFQVDWHYRINDRMSLGGRSGCDIFQGYYSYTIAQFILEWLFTMMWRVGKINNFLDEENLP